MPCSQSLVTGNGLLKYDLALLIEREADYVSLLNACRFEELIGDGDACRSSALAEFALEFIDGTLYFDVVDDNISKVASLANAKVGIDSCYYPQIEVDNVYVLD